ncbi:MAG: DegT/DnrJ/EryC1/StrS aminotransferase, partial [Planctomycetota bacterium]
SGGALLTRSDRLAARIDQLVDRPGDATAMSPLACAAVLPQWSTIDRDHQRREAAATQLQRFDWASIDCRVMDDYLSGGTLSIYKFPFFASSADHRQQLIARLDALGLPIGLGFRSLHRISSRRADRIGSLLSSKQFGECCVLIDHRVLLADDAVARVQRLVQQV